MSLRSTDPATATLASEGVRIQQRIRNWHDGLASQLDRTNPHVQVALASFYALELFHCKNYTFYSCWEDKQIPFLSRDEIHVHVGSILDLSERSLEASVVPGVLMLFPLRMAGVNASLADQRAKVVEILGRIYRTGFVVSERIKVDVQQVWQFRQEGSV